MKRGIPAAGAGVQQLVQFNEAEHLRLDWAAEDIALANKTLVREAVVRRLFASFWRGQIEIFSLTAPICRNLDFLAEGDGLGPPEYHDELDQARRVFKYSRIYGSTETDDPEDAFERELTLDREKGIWTREQMLWVLHGLGVVDADIVAGEAAWNALAASDPSKFGEQFWLAYGPGLTLQRGVLLAWCEANDLDAPTRWRSQDDLAAVRILPDDGSASASRTYRDRCLVWLMKQAASGALRGRRKDEIRSEAKIAISDLPVRAFNHSWDTVSQLPGNEWMRRPGRKSNHS